MELKVNIKGIKNKEKFISDNLKIIENRIIDKVTLYSNGDLLFVYSEKSDNGKTIVKQANKSKYPFIHEFLKDFYKQHAKCKRVWMLYKVIEFEGDWLIFFITEY